MAPMLKYASGDNVLCSWDSIKFQAKVIKVDSGRRASPYLVHYQGWKSRWDEWVPEGRLSGKGSGGKKGKMKKEKQQPQSSRTPTFDEPPEEDEDPPPTLERVVENGKVVYRTSDGKSLKTMTEMKKFCDRMELLFDATDYDFSPPPEQSKITRSTKASTSAANKKNAKDKSPAKARGKPVGRGLDDDLKEIKKAINNRGATSSTSNHEDVEMEVSVEMQDFKGVTTNLLEEGESFTTAPKRGRPPRQKRPNTRYSESGTGSLSPEPRRKILTPEKPPVASPKKGRTPTKPKSGGVIKVKTTSPKNRKRKREEEEAQEEQDAFVGDYQVRHQDEGIAIGELLSTEDNTEEFIEIQEHLHQQHNQQQQQGFHQSISPPPILAQQVPQKRRPTDVRRLPSAAVGITARGFQQHGFSVRAGQVPKREFIPAHVQEPAYAYHEAQEPLDEYERFAHEHLHPQQQIAHHQPSRPETVRTTSSFPLQGIRVTGQAPPADAPSRILMKLRAPEFKKSPRFKASLRVGPDGMEYIDSHYPPSIHTGGRGRFGVVGSGPPPAPIVPERLEDFCHLPAEVVGDHCYGKTPPVRAGGPVVTIRSTDDHHFGNSPIGKSYLSHPTRVHIAGPNFLVNRTIRVLPPSVASSASLMTHGSHHEASTAAAHLHSGAAGTFEDAGYSDGMAPPVLEGYVDGMEVNFEGEDIEPGGSSGGSRLSPTVTLMPHSHHVSLLSDKLPANILEGVEDPDMGADPSMGIH